mgnify:CR=1 FL=1
MNIERQPEKPSMFFRLPFMPSQLYKRLRTNPHLVPSLNPKNTHHPNAKGSLKTDKKSQSYFQAAHHPHTAA